MVPPGPHGRAELGPAPRRRHLRPGPAQPARLRRAPVARRSPSPRCWRRCWSGHTLGLVAGYAGGRVDQALMRVMDVFFSFPAVLLALGIVAALGPHPVQRDARDRRRLHADLRPRGPRAGARAQGARVRRGEPGARRPRRRGSSAGTSCPNLASMLVVQTSIALSWAILTEASLSFLGLSAQPPTPSWGAMLNEGRQNLELAPHLAVFPGPGDHAGRPRVQPPRRRAPRRARPAQAAMTRRRA